ncbi:exopolyphosphatase [Rothia nasimurium]|uniref:Ppx/GppA phosphatase family protein n=1 Tax=Rothia nasimurium TaxID=85336 RepID=UPI003BA21C46
MRVGAIDCGTNSIRLLIADVEMTETGPVLHELERRMKIVRLGKGVDATGWLAKESLDRTFAATSEYANLLQAYGVTDVRFAATSATRDAGNRKIFMDGIREILGVEPEVITGREEAELSFAGAVSSVGNTEALTLVVDLGGGSTEFVLGNKDGVVAAKSVDIGCVRMTERHISSDPANVTQISRVIADTDKAIATALSTVDLSKAERIVGVAGTVTTVVAHTLGLDSYDPARIDRAEIPIKAISKTAADMVAMTSAQRAELPYMHEGRVDVIPAGSVVWARICERISAITGGAITTAVASEKDILDGLALSVAARADH